MAPGWLMRARRLSVDVAACMAAFIIIIVLPILEKQDAYALESLAPYLFLYCVLSAASLYGFRTYRMIWRYVSFQDLLALISAVTLLVASFFALSTFATKPVFLVFTTFLSLWLTSFTALVIPRVVSRILNEGFLLGVGRAKRPHQRATQLLLTGDAEKMAAFIREVTRNPRLAYQIVGVFVENSELHGSHFHGTRVIGTINKLSDSVAGLRQLGYRPEMLVLARDKPNQKEFEQLFKLASDVGITLGQLPPAGAMHDGKLVRPVAISDLLGRPEISIVGGDVATLVKGKIVFITGAGGSIGSELCRQIGALNPSKIVLADASEFNLYSIELEIREKYPNVNCVTALLNVRDADLVLAWIRRYSPDIVFHAAALKHVPLLEDHVVEAVKTNVLGTINIADACRTCAVPLMCTISTDKAVNPCNVMGATKRLAEAYCQGMDQASRTMSATRYVTVRFGNVLGSAGSVVPLFQRQIERGGPVTVTHPEITRYFMTIPEAVCLVLQASAHGANDEADRGSIYVLDMGQPVNILELARQMIRLSGQRPDEDIQIKIIGLRSGEKLYEELAHAEEGVATTTKKSVLKVSPRATDIVILRQQVYELASACLAGDLSRIERLLRIAVPEYRPQISSTDQATPSIST